MHHLLLRRLPLRALCDRTIVTIMLAQKNDFLYSVSNDREASRAEEHGQARRARPGGDDASQEVQEDTITDTDTGANQ